MNSLSCREDASRSPWSATLRRRLVSLQAAINRFVKDTNEDPTSIPLDQGPRKNHRSRQTL